MCCVNWGAELVPFSPLTDERLPENIDGLYLWRRLSGIVRKQLSENEIMRDSIKTAILNGLPTVCRMRRISLSAAVARRRGNGWRVADFWRNMTHRLQPFGYVTLTANSDNLLVRPVDNFRNTSSIMHRLWIMAQIFARSSQTGARGLRLCVGHALRRISAFVFPCEN